jgi:hypothetical protein
MQTKSSERTFTLVLVILGIAGALFSLYKLYNYTVNGDQVGMFITGALLIIFTVFTINNYLKLRRLQRPNYKKNDSEEIL